MFFTIGRIDNNGFIHKLHAFGLDNRSAWPLHFCEKFFQNVICVIDRGKNTNLFFLRSSISTTVGMVT